LGYKNVVGRGHVVVLGRAQEPKAFLCDVENSLGYNNAVKLCIKLRFCVGWRDVVNWRRRNWPVLFIGEGNVSLLLLLLITIVIVVVNVVIIVCGWWWWCVL
jgi:hypothetical protein